ncbi:MAG: DUF4013 domain-containing protein [Pseudomonadota bacterium]
MGNLERALKYPFAAEGWGPKFILGGVLNFIGAAMGFIPYLGVIFWLLFSFFPLGYAYTIFRTHLEGREGPLPGWEGWGDLFRRGLYVFLIALGYGIVPGILYWLGLNLWYGGGFVAFVGVFLLILGVGIGLVAFFLLPMALALYASEGEGLAAAFHWKGIVEKIWLVQRDYFSGWVAGLVLFLALLFLKTQLLYIGWILYSFGFFYLSLSMANLFGEICREALKDEL